MTTTLPTAPRPTWFRGLLRTGDPFTHDPFDPLADSTLSDHIHIAETTHGNPRHIRYGTKNVIIARCGAILSGDPLDRTPAAAENPTPCTSCQASLSPIRA